MVQFYAKTVVREPWVQQRLEQLRYVSLSPFLFSSSEACGAGQPQPLNLRRFSTPVVSTQPFLVVIPKPENIDVVLLTKFGHSGLRGAQDIWVFVNRPRTTWTDCHTTRDDCPMRHY